MSISFLFPGQGSQFVGMGKDLYEKYPEVKAIYDRASDILGFDVKKISFDGPEEALNKTENTQIAILVNSLGILEVLKSRNIQANISAGLSLGEYTALIYSGMISFEDGVRIVKRRGEIMQENTPVGNWKMAGILGLDDDTVENVCKNVRDGFVVPANFNCPGQVVISGEEKAVDKAMELLKEAGARKATPLKTSGPFHTEKLALASEKLRQELNNIEIKFNPEKKVVKNLDASVYKDSDDFRDILAKHVMRPVRFKDTILEMLSQGVDSFVEIGPR